MDSVIVPIGIHLNGVAVAGKEFAKSEPHYEYEEENEFHFSFLSKVLVFDLPSGIFRSVRFDTGFIPVRKKKDSEEKRKNPPGIPGESVGRLISPIRSRSSTSTRYGFPILCLQGYAPETP